MSQRETGEKRFDPEDTCLKFVDRPDDLDPIPPEEGYVSLRAEMSCGHSVTPASLTGWCRSLIDQGQYLFRCPALKTGTLFKCDEVWSYQEVRRLAALTPDEMKHFEETLALLAAAEYSEQKMCPGCLSTVEREDLTNLCVECTVCKVSRKEDFLFCWQCLRPWKGKAPKSDCCANEGCANNHLELLKKCKDIKLPQVDGVNACPSIRACPTCGLVVEHDKSGCKNIRCPRCQVEFCFVCLKVTNECLKTSTHFVVCSDGVAPRQTSLPVWYRL